jgi:hypothetical protein
MTICPRFTLDGARARTSPGSAGSSNMESARSRGRAGTVVPGSAHRGAAAFEELETATRLPPTPSTNRSRETSGRNSSKPDCFLSDPTNRRRSGGSADGGHALQAACALAIEPRIRVGGRGMVALERTSPRKFTCELRPAFDGGSSEPSLDLKLFIEAQASISPVSARGQRAPSPSYATFGSPHFDAPIAAMSQRPLAGSVALRGFPPYSLWCAIGALRGWTTVLSIA